MRHTTKFLFFICALLILTAVHMMSGKLKRTAVECISEPNLAQAVNQTKIEQFPGEFELLKMLNDKSIRNIIHLNRGRTYADEMGLYYLNQPEFYGEADFMQFVQEQCSGNFGAVEENLCSIVPNAIEIDSKLMKMAR